MSSVLPPWTISITRISSCAMSMAQRFKRVMLAVVLHSSCQRCRRHHYLHAQNTTDTDTCPRCVENLVNLDDVGMIDFFQHRALGLQAYLRGVCSLIQHEQCTTLGTIFCVHKITGLARGRWRASSSVLSAVLSMYLVIKSKRRVIVQIPGRTVYSKMARQAIILCALLQLTISMAIHSLNCVGNSIVFPDTTLHHGKRASADANTRSLQFGARAGSTKLATVVNFLSILIKKGGPTTHLPSFSFT